MKFGFKTLFNLTLLKAAVIGILDRLQPVDDYLYMVQDPDRTGLDIILKRVMYLLGEDKAFLRLMERDQRYIVDLVLNKGRVNVLIYYAIDNAKQRIPDDVRYRRGFKQVHSDRCSARDRFRYVLYNGHLNVATRVQTRLLYDPHHPVLAYDPTWGDQLCLLLETATKRTTQKFGVKPSTSWPATQSHTEPRVPA